jgi:hypothetical protein
LANLKALLARFGFENLGSLTHSNIITPSQITADQITYGPTGLSTAFGMRLSTDAQRRIRSIPAAIPGRILWVSNVGTQSLILSQEDTADATAANRFSFGGNDSLIEPDVSMALIYDGTSSRWRSLMTPPPNMIRKRANESRTSNTLSADAALVTGTLPGVSYYELEVFLSVSGTAAIGGLQVSWTLPGSAFIDGHWRTSSVSALPVIQNSAAAVTICTAANMKTLQTHRFEGRLFLSGGAGPVTMNWAQATTNATPVNILSGSYLITQKLP